MYTVIKDFTDHLKANHKYKVGDAYEEQQEIWTKFLLDNGKIQKVELKKEKKGFFSKDENVTEKQE